jgi:hypothetical protein
MQGDQPITWASLSAEEREWLALFNDPHLFGTWWIACRRGEPE